MTPTPNGERLLVASGLTKRFGGLIAVDGANLQVSAQQVVGIIGPNGAGKTTLLNLLSGALVADAGTIYFDGHDISKAGASRRASHGLRRTFQNIRLFTTMTVLENVVVGLHPQTKGWLLGGMLGGRRVRQAEAQAVDRAKEVLDALGMTRRNRDLAGSLSYGEQRRVEIARALASSPRLLLLDEPAAGLNSSEKRDAADLIRSMPERFGVAVVLVEHDMALVSRTCSHVAVMDYGKPLCEGPPEKVLADPRVIEAYLGTEVASV